MKKSKPSRMFIAAVIIQGLLFSLSCRAEESQDIAQMIMTAKTAAEHQAIAEFYRKEAQMAHEKHAQHQKMGEAYAKQAKAGPRKRTGSVAHCTAIAGQFEKIAKEYEALANLHHDVAKESQ